MEFKEESEKWEAWVTFESFEVAFNASCKLSEIEINNLNIKGALCGNAPKNLDIYRPIEYCENKSTGSQIPISQSSKAP